MANDALLPGYQVDPVTGAWTTLPWPGDPELPMTDPNRLKLLPPSLGPQIIAWGEHWLVHHQTGEPWRFTMGQKRFIHMWWAINPKTGRFDWRSGIKRGAKGTGKDPFGAFVALAEFCGPVEFAGTNDQGHPVGRPRRLSKVQIAANSLNQASELLTVANAMISPALKNKLRIDTGMTRTMLPSGSRIELLTASERSTEGSPATAVILNETHHMTQSSGGHRIAEVSRRNVAKSPTSVKARALELTNAHQQGQDSVAERAFHAWQDQVAGKTHHIDILYDSIEAAPGLDITDEDQLRTGITQAYSDAPWADIDTIVAEAQDLRTSPAETVRFFLNGLAAAEEAWVDPAKFDALARPDEIVAPGEKVTLFLDCSKSSDATTLSGCRLSDGHVFSLGGWRRPHGDRGSGWLAPREVVDAVVREAFETYQVVWFGVDPSPAVDDATEALYWAPTIDQWHRDFARRLKVWATPGAGGHSVLFDMRMSQPGAVRRNRLFTEAAMQTAIDIDEEGTLTHDGDPMLRQHVHNARRRPNQWGVSIGKTNRSSKHLVDYAVTMIGARMGRTLVLRSTKVSTATARGARLLN
ncbi:terminase [Corynebacterium sp. TAE3-ERU12]|uniref:terminase n=1 Tax=Corynebacterium sp. TAE3-ERU12 TaxID=2849491 RepID=UPI001C44616E|nr:terminase [Corynebacterium sp. TAE3-ERU12]MBV7294919.1 terminase [Corynebacterium sp. TAE3-ERU12]